MNTRPFRPSFWATTLTLAGIFVLCGLGLWQLQRLAWKQDLMARINTAREAAPVAMDAAALAPLTGQPDILIRARLTGRYLHDHEILLKPRPMGQRTGAHLVTPFLLLDGVTIVPVLRGWVSDDSDTFIQRPESTLTINGIVRHPTQTNPFTPKNVPAQNMWFTLNPTDIAAARGLGTIVPLAFYEETNRDDVGWPIPVEAWHSPNNNHLSYAVFWFVMAGVLGVMYVLRFVVYGHKENGAATAGAGNGSAE